MSVKTKKIKTIVPNRLDHKPEKICHNKLRITNIHNNNLEQNRITFNDNKTLARQIEIEQLKSNGLIYAYISRFR